MNVDQMIDRHWPATVDLRHRLHQVPELGYEEFETARLIRAELDRLGIPHVADIPALPTATLAWIGDTRKPCIAFRADIDALPILERTDLEYASRNPGRMHACGHDGHIANLIGAAAIFQQIHQELPVCVKLIFQPAEEGGGGARRLVDAGALDGRLGPKVQAIFGLHGWPALKVGSIATKPGPLLASTDNFTITFRGKGCHGAFPHFGRDPIVAAADAILNLQQVISREMDPTEPAVVTVGQITGGTAVNVIPDSASFSGTARSLTGEARARVRAAIQRRCAGIAAAHACDMHFDWIEGYPPTINDPAMADYVAAVARNELGPDRFIPVARPSMGGEDFAYYLEQIPGCFFLIGVEPPACAGYPTLHCDLYDFTDEAMRTGMRMFVALARGWASRPPLQAG